MLLQVAVLVGTFVTVVFLLMAVYQIIFASRLTVLERLDVQTQDPVKQAQIARTGTKGTRGNVLNILGMLGKIFSRRSYEKKIQRKLTQAHLFLRADEYVGLIIVSGIGTFLLVYLLTGNLLIAVLSIALGAFLPNIYVSMKKNSRSKKLNQQLPEALNIIANGLRAGYSFPQAMDVVSKEMEAPIAEEFGRVIRENRLGKPMEEVLLELSERADDEDFDIFVTALIIQKQVGGNLAVILNNIEHTIRERVRIKGEIATLTAQQKLSAIIIVLLPIGVGLALFAISTDYMMIMFQEILGLILMGFAVLLQIIGIFVIRKIVQIEV